MAGFAEACQGVLAINGKVLRRSLCSHAKASPIRAQRQHVTPEHLRSLE
jgi:hypothetical protein